MAPLLPKLRGQFAEFLDQSSLDRLGILYLATCVGFGYGHHLHSLEAFLGGMASGTSLLGRYRASALCGVRIFLDPGLHAYPGTTIARVALAFPVTPSVAY
jgi:hypothetical protein